MNALTQTVKNLPEQTSRAVVHSRFAISIWSKILLPFLLIIASAMMSNDPNPLGWIGTGLIFLFLILTLVAFRRAWVHGDEVEDKDTGRRREQELKAHAKMRELGLKGRPYPVYFWEARPSAGRYREEDCILIEIKKLERADSYGSFIPGYLLKDATGETVAEVEESPEGETTGLKSTRVCSQRISVQSEDPEEAGLLSEEDERILSRTQAWVNSLNQQAKSEYKCRQKGQVALPPAPTPLDHKFQQVLQVQRRAQTPR